MMDAAEAGETYHLTRTEELVEKQRLPQVNAAELRREAEGFFGTGDPVGDDGIDGLVRD
ncbi:hypothetical protein [Amycolatopsis viridis]|uniref:Uncharacterized protein n=1 Tax=Amycolatopsis viridis TaxID=185678 RepID=A0ABX0SVW8_9PSEU|nr:hypothetical protein [Amycolatopsis viridis]NIH81108.1 hypothetical protein [Amycolatopsis viridis]